MTVSYKFLQEVPSKLEIQCEKGIYFSFDFAGILSILILSFKNMEWIWGGGWGLGGAGGLLNRQNLLSVTKVICRQSLMTALLKPHNYTEYELYC